MEAKASSSQSLDVELVHALSAKIENAQHLCRLLEKSGDRESARKNVLPKINELVAQRDALLAEINKNRRAACHDILMCFAAADLCATLADRFADTLYRISRGTEPKLNEFSRLLRDKGMEFEQIVQLIDEANSEPVETYYAEMSEKTTAAAIRGMDEVITATMKTKKGERYF